MKKIMAKTLARVHTIGLEKYKINLIEIKKIVNEA